MTNSDNAENKGLLEVALEIQKCESWDKLIQLVSVRFTDLFDLIDFKWIEYAVSWERVLWETSIHSKHERPIRVVMKNVVKNASKMTGYWKEVASLALGESDGIYGMRSHYTDEELRSLNVYKRYMEPLGMKENICFQCHFSDRGGAAVVFVSIGDEEMDLEDLIKLRYLRDHVRVACARQVRQASLMNLTEALNDVRNANQEVGISVLGSTEGKLLDVDEVSTDLISDLGGYLDQDRSLHLPDRLITWVSSEMETHTRLSAQTYKPEKVFRTYAGIEVSVTLMLEQAGCGALLVFRKSKNASSEAEVTYTKRELEVLHGLCAGMTNTDIAKGLSISARTVDKHVENVFKKLGVQDREAAKKKYGCMLV